MSNLSLKTKSLIALVYFGPIIIIVWAFMGWRFAIAATLAIFSGAVLAIVQNKSRGGK